MAGFLRKKSKQQPQPQGGVLRKERTPAPAPSTAPPPLFARFATGGSGSSGGGGGEGSTKVVSGPMALGGRRDTQRRQQYPEPPQQQQSLRGVDKPLPAPVLESPRGRAQQQVPSAYQPPPPSQSSYFPQQADNGPIHPQRPPSAQGTPPRPPSSQSHQFQYQNQNQPRPPSSQSHYAPPPPPAKQAQVQGLTHRQSILRDPNPPPNLAMFESSTSKGVGRSQSQQVRSPQPRQEVQQQGQRERGGPPPTFQQRGKPLLQGQGQQQYTQPQQRPPSVVQQQQQRPPSQVLQPRPTSQYTQQGQPPRPPSQLIQPGPAQRPTYQYASRYANLGMQAQAHQGQGQQQGQQGTQQGQPGQGQGQAQRRHEGYTGYDEGDVGLPDEVALFQEYSQTIPTPPDSLGINSRQSQPLPVEKDNNNNKGTPDGSSGNLGKEEHAASGSILATTPSDTAEMGGAFSRMVSRRSPELQRGEGLTSSTPSSPLQQQQQRQMMQQNDRRRQPVVVPPHAPAPVQNYSIPLRAPVAVASRASPLANANPNSNHVIRQPAYAPVEVEPGFPTPSPPPSIPLPPTSMASASSPPRQKPLPPTFPSDFSPSSRTTSDSPYPAFSASSSPPTKSPSMRAVNVPRGKPLIFAAMANVEDEPPMQKHQSERRVNGMASPQMQGRGLPQGVAPPMPFASPRTETPTLNDAEPMLKNRPISGVLSSSPPKSYGPRPTSKVRTPSPPAVPNSPSQNMHSPRMHGPRQLPPPSSPQNPRVKGIGKGRGGGGADINGNGSSEGGMGPGPSSTSSISVSPPFFPSEQPRLPPKGATSSIVDPSSDHVDEETARKAGLPLDDDPFARSEGVKMLPPSSPPASRDGPPALTKKVRRKEGSTDDSRSIVTHESRPSTANREHGPLFESETPPVEIKESKEAKEVNGGKTTTSSSPSSPDDTRSSRKLRVKAEKLAATASATQPQSDLPFPKNDPEDRPPSRMDYFSLTQFLADPHLLSTLLSFLSFYEWLVLSSISREIRIQLVQNSPLREEVLERYLKTVGYSRWMWDGAEPLSLSLQDLADYMRGVSIPTHEYGRIAAMYVQSLSVHPNLRDPEVDNMVRSYTAATRAYTRVVLRLRAQAEREHAALQRGNTTPTGRAASLVRNGYTSRTGASRASSRAPSPTQSSFSHGQNHMSPGGVQQAQSLGRAFQSPLFRIRRAPLLRVFVPSPEGDWLSDKSVLECEAECKRAGVQHLLRMGDVVWDVAVGDEGNVGRLVWDGSYLIDLDYTYSRTGDLPKYLPSFAFPPSYFHRVIRTGVVASNPIVHIDISPWGNEIAANLQLLQDRVKTETPQGAIHNVVRWVNRSSFAIRPPPPRPRHPPPRIPIPDSDLFVDLGWYGTIVVETEGTNEALADLQDRCGHGAFPPRVRPVAGRQGPGQAEARKVWRILREKSRPGEVWIKAVTAKERLLPPPV